MIKKDEIPRVTEILRKLGLSKDFRGVSPFYKERGEAVHLAIRLCLEGNLDESTIDPACDPYFEAFKKWRIGALSAGLLKDLEFSLEKKITASDFSFQGTLDAIIEDTIWDWKCTEKIDPASDLQLCAYGTLYPDAKYKKILQLKGDGTYMVHDRSHLPNDLWKSVMDLYAWKTGKYSK